MQICRYKLENNTLNSVLDCDSNKTIYYEKDILKGAEVMFGERYAFVIHFITLFTFFGNIV
jgi:hypothetical protein